MVHIMVRLCAVATTALILALGAPATAQQPALYPSLEGNVALSVPIVATETCELETAECFDAFCTSCNSTCPYGQRGLDDPNDDEFSGDGGVDLDVEDAEGRTTVPQGVCACAGGYDVDENELLQCCDDVMCRPRVNPAAHPIQLAVDGDMATYWQSPSNQLRVDVNFDLRAQMELSELVIEFATRRPQYFVLQKSMDGEDWEDYQFFAVNCENTFGMKGDAIPQTSEDVVCVTTESSASFRTVRFSPLDSRRPPTGNDRDYNNNPGLQRFARARFLRFLLRAYHDEDSAQTPFGDPLDIAPFYAIREIQVSARCFCNGHASSCPLVNVFDPLSSRQCECEHNTQGATCDSCLPLYNRKPWAAGIDDVANPCLACECNNHALSCHYDRNVDQFPDERGRGDGGVCDNCMHNTAGQNCETCQDGFYENPAVSRDSVDACLACGCDARGVENGNTDCDVKTGQCQCKRNVEGIACDVCKPGFFGLSDLDRDGCRACACDPYGSVNGTFVCDAANGQCPCKDGYTGRDCGQCERGLFKASPQDDGVCTPCHPECGDLGCISAGARKGSACLDCRNVESEGLCVAQCPPNTYNEDGVCQPCHSQCSGGCTGAGPQNCVACLNFEINGTCVAACPALSFPNAQRQCVPCDSQCAEGCTGPLPTDCRSCLNARDDNRCVAQCPLAKYRGLSGVCEFCHRQCDGCDGPGSHSCLACKNFNRTNPDTGVSECVNSCNTQEFVVDRNCAPCHPLCADGCTGPTASDCSGNCLTYRLDDTCVEVCPSHTYATQAGVCLPCDPACSDRGCKGPLASQCIACGNSSVTVEQTDGTLICALECPEGTFEGPDRVCLPCHEECEACWGPRPDECSKCKASAYSSRCVAACPTLTFSAPFDVERVVNITSASRTCIDCNEQCLEACNAESSTSCVGKCRNARFKGDCVARCPNGTFNDNGECRACHPQCDGSCSGPSAQDCVACKRLLDAGRGCVSSCLVTQYADPIARECKACSEQCSDRDPGCTGPRPSQCTACKTLYDIASGACVSQCPPDSYPEANECRSCDPLCQGCTGPSAAQCKACKFASLNNICVDQCPLGYFRDDSGVCVACHPECAGPCSGPSNSHCLPYGQSPTGCLNFLRDTVCVSTCDGQTYPSGEPGRGGTCRPCHTSCSGSCKGPSRSDCTSCTGNFYLAASGRCEDCNPECADGGCSGPGADQCRFGCRSFTSFVDSKTSPRCVIACPVNSYVADRPVARSCQRCHSSCEPSQGCTGPSDRDCNACVALRLDDRCVARCPTGYSANDNDVCRPCNEECQDGCSAPDDASSCTRCAHFADLSGRCVASCPTSAPVYFGAQCLEECPATHPYRNDTRSAAKFTPSPCLASCLQLGDVSRVYVSTDDPFLCTTEAQAKADSKSSGSDDDVDSTLWIVLGAAIALIVGVLVVALVVRWQRHTGSVAIADISQHSGPRVSHGVPVELKGSTGGESDYLYDVTLGERGKHNTYMELSTLPSASDTSPTSRI